MLHSPAITGAPSNNGVTDHNHTVTNPFDMGQ
jgi:hypothetical protein